MQRLTHERCNGIKSGYWSASKKDELIERLAAYENTGLKPEDIPSFHWYSPDIKPHNISECVLVICSGEAENFSFENAYAFADYDSDSDEWTLSDYFELEQNITIKAWMPLPEFPRWLT